MGLVVLLSEPTDVQPGHASTKLRAAMDEARQRIEAYEEVALKEKMKAPRNEKTVLKVRAKVDFLDQEGNRNALQWLGFTSSLLLFIRMKGGKLLWTWTEKGTTQSERISGPSLDASSLKP